MLETNHLNIVEEGTGRPVLFIHGFLESSSMWSGISIDGVRKIMPDLPGHGSSPHFNYHDLVEIAEILIDYLHKNNVSTYDVVGHSMGGYIALEMKATDQGCQKVVLLNSNFWGDSEKKKEDRKRVAELVIKKTDLFVIEAIPALFFDPQLYDKEVKELISDARKISGEAIASASLAMMRRPDRRNIIRTYGRDIFIIQGTHDLLTTPKQMSEYLPAEFENLYEIEASHMSWIESPEEVTKSLQDILN